MGGVEEQLQACLEAWFEALEAGAEPDALALCGGDRELAERLQAIVAFEAAAVSGLGESTAPAATLGDFNLREEIGAGGMGRVFLAVQGSLQRLVAVKILDAATLSDPHSAARFRREAEITAALDHPAIVPIYAVGEENGTNYLAMKWLTGPSLDALTEPVAPEETARIGAAIASALDAAHRSGVVHRDVKPGNVILDDGRPFIVDFGLARTDADAALTRTGAVPGTLAYLAPERLEPGAQGLDPRSDVYSLGATLYELVTGRRLFGADDVAELAREILLREPRRLGLPRDARSLEAIIETALAKDPARRYATAADMSEDLECFLRGEPVTARRRSLPGRLLSAAARRPRVTTAVGLLLIVVAALVLRMAFIQRDADSRFAERLAAGRNALAEGRLAGAAEISRTLEAERGDDRELKVFAADVARRRAYERLLDQVIDAPAAQNGDVLDRLVEDFERTDARRLDPDSAAVALSLADLLRGDIDGAVARLEEFPDRRAARILLAYAKDRSLPRLPDAPAASPDENVFAAAYLYALGAPAADVERELRRTLDDVPDHRRGLMTWAIIRSFEGDYDEALRVFGALANRDDGLPIVRRYVGQTQLRIGELDAAEESLQSIAPEDRDPMWFTIASEILQRRGTKDWFDPARRALETWPGDASLLLVRAKHETSIGDLPAAHATLGEIVAKSGSRRMREIAGSTLVYLRVHEALGRRVGMPLELDAETLEELKKIREDALVVAGEAAYHVARAQALLVSGWAALHTEGLEEAAAELSRASAASKTYHRPRRALLHLLHNTLLQRSDLKPPVTDGTLRLVLLGETTAEGILADRGAGHAPPAKIDIDVAHLALVRAAYLKADVDACLERAEEARPRFADGTPHAVVLDWFLENLGR